MTWLDVSRNKLKSAKLGTQPQLPNLVTLILSGNEISVLQKNDFSFLSNSSAFRVLILSSLSLKKVRGTESDTCQVTFTDCTSESMYKIPFRISDSTIHVCHSVFTHIYPYLSWKAVGTIFLSLVTVGLCCDVFFFFFLDVICLFKSHVKALVQFKLTNFYKVELRLCVHQSIFFPRLT